MCHERIRRKYSFFLKKFHLSLKTLNFFFFLSLVNNCESSHHEDQEKSWVMEKLS